MSSDSSMESRGTLARRMARKSVKKKTSDQTRILPKPIFKNQKFTKKKLPYIFPQFLCTPKMKIPSQRQTAPKNFLETCSDRSAGKKNVHLGLTASILTGSVSRTGPLFGGRNVISNHRQPCSEVCNRRVARIVHNTHTHCLRAKEGNSRCTGGRYCTPNAPDAYSRPAGGNPAC